MTLVSDGVRALAGAIEVGRLPAYVYDLDHLRAHLTAIRAALPEELELYYAAKANPEPEVLRVAAEIVDGFDVSSGGELAHVRASVPELPVAFSGPGKSVAELTLALDAGVELVHVESLHELDVLEALARGPVDVLLRVNIAAPDALLAGSALSMGGSPSAFGLDTGKAVEAMRRAAAGRWSSVRVCGVHAHLASGLEAGQQVHLAEHVVGWAVELFSARTGCDCRR